jgi:Acetyltransferase (GNAT) family
MGSGGVAADAPGRRRGAAVTHVIPIITPYAMDSFKAASIWWWFAGELGAQALLDCYGWSAPPVALRPGESAWMYLEGRGEWMPHGPPIGWGSIIKDPTTRTFWQCSGVFPEFQRRGYRQAIRQHLCAEAFARDATAVSLVVLDTNPQHLERCHREADAGSPWQPSARKWRPEPRETTFTLLLEDARRVVPYTTKTCCCTHLWLPGECPREVTA